MAHSRVLVNDLFVMHQHAIWHRVVIAYDGIHQLVHELVGIEAELVDRPWHHRLQKGCTWHVSMLLQPCFESAGYSRRARHPAYAGWQVKHALALSNCELPEEEERFARLVATQFGLPRPAFRYDKEFSSAVFDATFWTKSLISNGPSLSNSFSLAVSDNGRLPR